MPPTHSSLIGSRIKAARERRGLSQDALADRLGFKDRQSVSAIKTGERRVSADELVLAMEALAQPLDYFTDPFRLDDEAYFSRHQTGVEIERLVAYERSAGRWVADAGEDEEIEEGEGE